MLSSRILVAVVATLALASVVSAVQTESEWGLEPCYPAGSCGHRRGGKLAAIRAAVAAQANTLPSGVPAPPQFPVHIPVPVPHTVNHHHTRIVDRAVPIPYTIEKTITVKKPCKTCKLTQGNEAVHDQGGILTRLPKPPQDPGMFKACNDTVVTEDRRALQEVDTKIQERRQALDRMNHWIVDAEKMIQTVETEVLMTNQTRHHVEADIDDLLATKERLLQKVRQDEIKRDLDQARRTLLDLVDQKTQLSELRSSIELKKHVAENQADILQNKLDKFPQIEVTPESVTQWPTFDPKDYDPVQ